FHQPGPTKVFRPRLPGATCTVPSEGLVVVGTEKYGPLTLPPAAIALEFAITASEKNCGPPVPAEVGVWARKGRAPTPSKESYPYCKVPYGPTTLNGKPVWALKMPSIFHPCANRDGTLGLWPNDGSYSKFATNRCATLYVAGAYSHLMHCGLFCVIPPLVPGA